MTEFSYSSVLGLEGFLIPGALRLQHELPCNTTFLIEAIRISHYSSKSGNLIYNLQVFGSAFEVGTHLIEILNIGCSVLNLDTRGCTWLQPIGHHNIKDFELFGRIQRKVTRMVMGLEGKPYEELLMRSS